MGAIMLVGSVVVMRTVYVPARERVDDQPGAEFAEMLRKLMARFVMIASAWLLISGIISFILFVNRYEIDKSEFPGSMYHMIFGIKFLIALCIFFLTAALNGRTSLAQKMREREKTWLTVNLVLVGLIVFLAAILRLADRTEKSESSALPVPPAVAILHDSASEQAPGEIG
jgi:hypothetical protein